MSARPEGHVKVLKKSLVWAVIGIFFYGIGLAIFVAGMNSPEESNPPPMLVYATPALVSLSVGITLVMWGLHIEADWKRQHYK